MLRMEVRKKLRAKAGWKEVASIFSEYPIISYSCIRLWPEMASLSDLQGCS